MPSLTVFVRANFRWKLMDFITGDGLCKDWESWALQVWKEDGFQVVNARNDQYLFKSVGFDAALRPLPVPAILLVPVGCAAALSSFQWNDRRKLWTKAVPITRGQSCSRICILKNCSKFLEVTQNFPMSWSCWINIAGLVVAVLGWIVMEKQQQYWVSLLSAAKSNLCFFSVFFHLNFEILFLYCDSRVSPLKQMLKALNGRVVALERLTDP